MKYTYYQIVNPYAAHTMRIPVCTTWVYEKWQRKRKIVISNCLNNLYDLLVAVAFVVIGVVYANIEWMDLDMEFPNAAAFVLVIIIHRYVGVVNRGSWHLNR